MIVNDWFRLILYIAAMVIPIWVKFFTTSTDYTLRGLAIPILESLGAAVVVMLARTKGRTIDGPADVNVPRGESVTITGDTSKVTATTDSKAR